MTGLRADLRHAVRRLRRAPWYAGGVVSVLAIGLALATVASAVVDGVLFKPLPFDRPQELFLVRADASATAQLAVPLVSGREIDAWKRALPDLAVTVVNLERFPDTRGGRERVSAAVDEAFFDVIGVRPILGGFTPDDFDGTWRDRPVSLWPTLISYQQWQREYGADPGVAGRIVITRTDREGRQYGFRIAGVLPEMFVLPVDGREVSGLTPLTRGLLGSERTFHVVARVPAAVASVDARLLGATRRLAEQPPIQDHHARPQDVPFDSVRLLPVRDHLTAQERPAFALIFGASALLLLLASLNVASLTAARNLGRRTDLAILRALGAGRGAILRGLLIETALLTLLALGLALLLARPLLVWTVSLLPASISLLKEPALDLRVFACAAIFAAVCVAIVSAWPAIVALRTDPRRALHAVTTSTPRAHRSHTVLVAAQVALGFVLLTAGGLTAASVAAAYRNDTGYRRHHAVLLQVFAQRPSGQLSAIDTLRSLPAVLETVPGVQDVAVSTISTLFAFHGDVGTTVVPDGWSGDVPGVVSRQVDAKFFEVMGARLIDGRWPTPGEWAIDRPVVLVSETAARTMWPDRSAVGRTMVPRSTRTKGPARTVIGVVADARFASLDEDPAGDIYLPDPLADAARTGVFFHVRTTAPADGVLPSLLAALAGRGLLITQATTHEDALFASVKHRILPAWLFGSLGIGALVMLAAGVLGLLGMSVAQRTREVGIRMALGATPARVVMLMMREHAAGVAIGVIAGAVVCGWLQHLLAAQLYGVDAGDAGVRVLVAGVIVLAAGAGALLPSLRAARVNPTMVLRDT